MSDPPPIAKRLAYGFTASGLVALAGTGFAGYLTHGQVSGWLLIAHVLSGPVFTVGLLMLGLTLAERCAGRGRVRATQRVIYWSLLALGLVSIVSILGAMTPAFGYDGLKTLYVIHRISGMGLVGVAGVHIVLLAMPRRRR